MQLDHRVTKTDRKNEPRTLYLLLLELVCLWSILVPTWLSPLITFPEALSAEVRRTMPRRNFQHYIPRFFLNGFSCDGSHIWTFSRRDGLQRRRVENVFGEQHLYSQKTVDRTNRASKSFELTKFEQSVQKDPRPYERDAIGKLESAAAPIVRHLIDQLRHGRIPPMRNTADILTLQRFLYLSARRTPESQIRVFADLYREADRSAFQRIRNSVPYNDEYSFETAEELYCQFPIARRIRDIHRENVAAQFAAGVESTRRHRGLLCQQ